MSLKQLIGWTIAVGCTAHGDEIPLPNSNQKIREAIEKARDVAVCRLIVRGEPFPGSVGYTRFNGVKFGVEKTLLGHLPYLLYANYRIYTNLGGFKEAVPQEGKSYILIGELVSMDRFDFNKMLAATPENLDAVEILLAEKKAGNLKASGAVTSVSVFDWPAPGPRPTSMNDIWAAIEEEKARADYAYRKRLSVIFVIALFAGVAMIWRIIRTPPPRLR